MSPDPEFQLPPGQTLTDRFPVVGEAQRAPGYGEDDVAIEIAGCVDRPLWRT